MVFPESTFPTSLPTTYIRGGTSKALFFREHDLPPSGSLRDALFLRIMGSPDQMQIDGMGGTHVVTSKIAVIAPSQREGIDVDYTFYQIGINEARISHAGNCGNISAGVGPFTINQGLAKTFRNGVSPDGGKTSTQEIRIFNTGTKKTLITHVPIHKETGKVIEFGDYAIAGCPGTGAPILMDYRDVTGGTLGKGPIPTGNSIDEVKLNSQNIQVTIIDIGNLLAFAKAEDLGISGGENALDLTADKRLIALVKKLRGLVAQKLGLCKNPDNVDQESPMMPMIVLISKPTDPEAHVQSRLFLDNKCHTAMALTGGVASAGCSRVKGSIINQMLDTNAVQADVFKTQHPCGILPISIQADYPDETGLPQFKTLSFVRTSRLIFKGDIFIPEDFQKQYMSEATHTNRTASAKGKQPNGNSSDGAQVNGRKKDATKTNWASSIGEHANGLAEPEKPITKSLVSFITNFGIHDLTQTIRDKLSQLLLDYVGMAISGAQIPESSKSFQKAVSAMVGSSEGSSTVLGTTLQLPAPYAALLNGAHSHSLDFDDTHIKAALHPGVSVVSAAFAEAEAASCSTEELLSALALGYEVTCRLGMAIGGGSYKRGFHNTGTCGIFGAVAAISKLRKLDSATTENAFGLALSMASGSMQYLENGSWNKRLHPGLAAQNAFQAVAFAEAGVEGAASPLEGPFGFLHAYSGEYDSSQLLKDLGTKWTFLSTALKPYPACRMTHGQIEIVDQLAKGRRRETVDEIEVKMSSLCFPVVGSPVPNKIHPENIVDAQFSVYYQIAVAFLYGSSLGWSVYDYLQDEEVKKLSGRIKVEVGDVPNATATTVTIRWANGQTTSESEEYLLWEDERPITWDALEAKFKGLTSSLVGREKADNIVNWARNMSRYTVGDLMREVRM